MLLEALFEGMYVIGINDVLMQSIEKYSWLYVLPGIVSAGLITILFIPHKRNKIKS